MPPPYPTTGLGDLHKELRDGYYSMCSIGMHGYRQEWAYIRPVY